MRLTGTDLAPRTRQSTGSELMELSFMLRNRPIAELMRPRAAITWLDVDRPVREHRQTVAEADQETFPVCRGSLDHVLGVIGPRQVRAAFVADGRDDLLERLDAPLRLRHTLPLLMALEMMGPNQDVSALVVDEDDRIVGLVTARSLLECLVNQALASVRPPRVESISRWDGSWLLDGLLPIAEFRALFGRDWAGDRRGREQHRLAGFVMAQLDRLPTAGDAFEWEGLRIEVVDMDGRRIDKLLVTPCTSRGVPTAENTQRS